MITESYLTTEEIHAWLRIDKRTLYRMAVTGRIPAARVGRQWRFRKLDIDNWLQVQKSSQLAPSAVALLARHLPPTGASRPGEP